MNRIEQTFAKARAAGKRTLMPYLMAGDPSITALEKLIPALAAAGADLLELGLPYSDPLLDGPVIQESAQRALAMGTTVRGVLSMVQRVRSCSQIPINLMTSYNLIYRFPTTEFLRRAAEVGVDGLIIPDLPADEAGELVTLARQVGLSYIPLVAPTSPPKRLQAAAELASGFIYCISITGVTGERQTIAGNLQQFINRVREKTDLPLAVGFGIANREQVRIVSTMADGVIVGSAVVRKIADCQGDNKRLLSEVSAFVKDLAQGLDVCQCE